jgi:hypothetical protein
MSDVMNHVMEIMSKSQSRHLVTLQGKLKLTEKKNLQTRQSLLYFSIFQCIVISRFLWLIQAEA